MALDENNGGIPATMLVSPSGYAGGNNGGLFGGGDSWLGILFLIALLNGGWGGFGGFGGGYGAMMGGFGGMYEFPWLFNGQQNINTNTNNGFRDAMINDNITSVRDGIAGLSTQLCGCCGDMQMAMANGFAGVNLGISNGTAAIQNSLCNGFNGVNSSINGAQNAISQQLYSNEIANLNRSFAEQTANTAGFTTVNTGVADLKYTLASEACTTRAANTANTQAILDKLCQLELDNYKTQIEAKNDQIGQLRSQLQYANMQASQVDQTAQLRASQATTANQLVNELRSCPIPSQPVYGNQPIFNCNSNNGCGCGCGNI